MKTQQRNDATPGLKQVTRLAFLKSAKTLSKMPIILFWFPFDGLPEDCVLYQIPVLPDLTTSKLTQTFLILSLGYGSEIPNLFIKTTNQTDFKN